MTLAPIPPPVPDDAPVPPPPDISASLPQQPAPDGEVLAAGKKSGKSSGSDSGTSVASNEPAQGGPFTGLQLNNSKSPIDINSESMSLDYKNHSVLWTGHVHANQANAQMTSDKLQVNYNDKDMKDMKDIVAMGNVRISQGTRWATGDHGVMDQTKHTIVLTGSPVVHDGNDQITGSKITVYLDTGRSVVEGAHAVIFPHQGDEADNTASKSAPDSQ
jgi:lipopolysaccharide export system protein LptA